MSAALAYPENVPADQTMSDAHMCSVGGDPNSEQATQPPAPIHGAPARPNLPADQPWSDAHSRGVGGDPNGSGHHTRDTQKVTAAAPTSPGTTRAAPDAIEEASGPRTPAPEQAMVAAPPTSVSPARAPLPPAPAIPGAAPNHPAPVLAETDRPRGPASYRATTTVDAPGLADPLLALAAEILDDLERVHIANANRLRHLTRTEADSDGLERGLGLPPDDPAVRATAALVDACKQLERQATRDLERLMRKHPLGPWAKTQRGIGDKQLARLLAVIGDPYWHSRDERPRTVAELRSYAGWGDARAQVRRRGEKANWSDTAKKRAWVIADSCKRQLCATCKSGRPEDRIWAEHGEGCTCSPYRLIYDAARRTYEGTVHDVECRRCGPKGKPAPPGSARSPGHQEAMAYRAVAKEVLRDLWREAKRLHEQHATR